MIFVACVLAYLFASLVLAIFIGKCIDSGTDDPD